MNTRTIAYIDKEEDLMDAEITLALSKSMNENFTDYCKLIRSIFAMSGIETNDYSPEKKIYYIEK